MKKFGHYLQLWEQASAKISMFLKEEILALATLPNREGLLSMLLSVLQAPVRNVALAVKAVADNKEDAA